MIVLLNYVFLYYLNNHVNINLFYSTQCGSLPLFSYVLYYEVFIFIYL